MQHIANTILQQLGNGRFLAMTGAKDLVCHPSGLQMRLPSRMTKNRAAWLLITLDPTDTYSLKFYNIRNLEVREVETVSGVYVESLRETFTRKTGLDVHL